MSSVAFSTAHLDYLQRTGFAPNLSFSGMVQTNAPPHYRRLWWIKGVGRLEKQSPPKRQQPSRLPSEDVIVSMYGHQTPLAFLIRGNRNAVDINLGIWGRGTEAGLTAKGLDARQQILGAALNSLYPAIETTSAVGEFPRLPLCGFVMGIPTAKPPDPSDYALPLDRLIRAVFGGTWACLVLAEPVTEPVIRELRNSVVNETRRVQTAAHAEKAPSPLAEYYTELLKAGLQALGAGVAIGVWRTAVYLAGDTETYHRLTSVWRGVFSGKDSRPEPVRVWDNPGAAELAANWSMPDIPAAPGPGLYHHPCQFQSLLSSSQLAAYIHLPQLETAGFAVRSVPRFDVVPPRTETNKTISLGRVMLYGRPTETLYSVDLSSLTRHVFVAGITGAGKTKTLFHLLKQAAGNGVPFLVIEPAKSEYRSLLSDPAIRESFQIFTLGSEIVSPFRLNPFEMSGWPQTSLGMHIDLLRAVFTSSFAMWTPLPQILEQCLYQVYRDRGWDITANENPRRGNADLSTTFPTLSELYAKADLVTQQMAFDPEARERIRGSLLTRLNALRTGAKGRMLDVQRSLPMKCLLEKPTLLELESMGDDDEKGFMMAMLFIRLFEHRRAQLQKPEPCHLLVIEEAHRLLTNVASHVSEEEANPRGKAVETFSNLLSEIRSYNQGVVVVDQVPVKLAPDVIKNTNLKIVHRILAEDDRKALAGATAMTEQQAKALAILKRQQAAAFSEGDDEPLLVQVADVSPLTRPNDAEVAAHMKSLRARSNLDFLLMSHPDCAATDPKDGASCHAARLLVEDSSFSRDFGRMVLSCVEDPAALARLWPDILTHVRAQRRPFLNEIVFMRCLIARASDWFANYRGAQAGWSYADTTGLAETLRQLLFTKLKGDNCSRPLKALAECMYRLHSRPFPPYSRCEDICNNAPLCLYRQAAQELVESGELADGWEEVFKADLKRRDLPQTWVFCQESAQKIFESGPEQHEANRRVSLCIGQLLCASEPQLLPRSKLYFIDLLIKQAQLGVNEEEEK